jgi:DNA uptake protein ComE-like DNA-binding protein
MKRSLLNLAFATLALTAFVLPARAQTKGDIPVQNNDKADPATNASKNTRAKAIAARSAAKAKAKAEALAKALDINRATKDELVKGLSVAPATADAIIAKRPYKTKADLIGKGVLSEGAYQGLRERVAVK